MTFVPSGIVSLLTDFGSSDGYVAQMKAVMLGVAPDLRFVDISHEIAPQNVAQGAFLLAESAMWFPAGTVHLAVVDPGVGSDRSAVALLAGGHVFIGPDNGLLMGAAESIDGAIQAWSLDDVPIPHGGRSSTFHGRDLFAPAAALVAAGDRRPETLGREVAALLPSPLTAASADRARVVHVDRFGNLITSLAASALAEGSRLEVAGRTIETRVEFYAEAPAGALVFLEGSTGRIEVSVAGGSAAEELAVGVGAEVGVRGT